MLTAHEFIAQGTTPAQVLSIAKAQNDSKAYHALRNIAHEVGRLTGKPLPKRAANTNRKSQAGKQAGKRMAA